MQDLLRYLTPLNPVLKSAQYSLGGNWENAVKISLDDPQDTVMAGDIDDSVAVELFYELTDGRAVFLGLRYSDGLALASTPTLFFQKVLGVIGQAKRIGLNESVRLLGEALCGDPGAYARAPINRIEIGVEGYWKSEGSLVLRGTADKKLEREALVTQLDNHPHLARSTKNHIAVEFATNDPESWIGIQVSREETGVFKTDSDAVLTLANLV